MGCLLGVGLAHEGIQIARLYKRKELLHRSHGKLIWPQEHKWHHRRFNKVAGLLAAVIRSVIDEHNRSSSPCRILCIHMRYQLGQEEAEGAGPCPASVHREEHPPIAGDGCNDIHREQSLRMRGERAPPIGAPAPGPIIGRSEDRLVDIDDHFSLLKGLNELLGSELSEKAKLQSIVQR